MVVVGASMGGIQALETLVASLPKDFPAAVFVVVHVSPTGPSILAQILARAGRLPAEFGREGETIQPGRIYVGEPNRHLLIHDGDVRVVHGPRENRWRPAIDPLFRSAAIAYRSRTVGVVLTGLLDDGTAGLSAIKRCGGVAIVQDPQDAEFPDMPASVLDHVEVDLVLPLAKIGPALVELSVRSPKPPPPIPEDLLREVRMMEQTLTDIRAVEELGPATGLMCPDCGGPLHTVQGDPLSRYRCHVGHAFTARALLEDQSETIERTLWMALRSFEERARVLQRLAHNALDRGHAQMAAEFETRAFESHSHATVLRRLLLGGE